MDAAATELINHASVQSDRWLFVALLVVMGIALVWIFKFFIAQNAADRAEHKADREAWEVRRTEHERTLKGLVEDGHKTVRELTLVLQTNTTTLRECSRRLGNFPTGGEHRNEE